MRRIETFGSIFEVDEDLEQYRRWPKHEKPRDKPEWGSEEAGLLQDFVWHPLVRWGVHPHEPRLIIQSQADTEGHDALSAPVDTDVWLALRHEGRVWKLNATVGDEGG